MDGQDEAKERVEGESKGYEVGEKKRSRIPSIVVP
jgi:hypothetical protein